MCNRSNFGRAGYRLIGLLIVFAVLCKVVTGRNFLSLANLLNILGQNANLLIIGVGITFIMLGGGMDLSTGFLVATVGITMAMLNGSGLGFLPTILIGIALAVALSALNGAVYAWLKVFPFIITLATQYILNGCAFLLTGGVSKTFRELSGGFKVLGGSNVLKFLTKLGVNLNGVSLKSGVLVAIVMVALGIVLLAAIILDTLQAESVQKRAKLVAGQDPALGSGAEK